MKEKHEEKQAAGEIVLRGRFTAWLDNFWYHYKWPVIGIAVAVVILLICTLQTCSKEREDIRIVYAGPTAFTSSELEQFSTVMDAVMPYDSNGDEQQHTAWTTYMIYSKEQIEEILAQPSADGEKNYVDRSFNSDQYSTYNSFLKTGETSIYFLDPWLYEELRTTGHLAPLSDVLDGVPEGALDEYGVRLGDTGLYRKYKALHVLPEDTVICLMRQYVIGKSSDDEAYRFECDMFRAIVTVKKES